MGFSLCLATLLFMSGVIQGASGFPEFFYPVSNSSILSSSDKILFKQPFDYFGSFYSSISASFNGFLSFSENPISSEFNPYFPGDIIAPLWTDYIDVNATVFYEEVLSDNLLQAESQVIQGFNASWLFIVTWDRLPYAQSPGDATFQVILASNGSDSFILFNYGDIDSTKQDFLAGYKSENNSFSIQESNSSMLSQSNNTNQVGQWIFKVDSDLPETCEMLQCTEMEVCTERTGVYGCGCSANNPRPNPNTFDFTEECAGSSGWISLSRCQLFEAGFFARFLHLQDKKCKGFVQGDRVKFHFDNSSDLCGTVLKTNNTHFIYENSIQAIFGSKTVISRDRWLGITFSCVYPLIQSISMTMPMHANGSVISKDLSTEGTYEIRMVPYSDDSFSTPFSGEIMLEVNQQMYVAVEVDGVDSKKIAVVLDNCWATPVNESDHNIRWDLITNECSNHNDGTVQVLKNGVSTSSHFSFRMFTFTAVSDKVFLHCQVHLCLKNSGECTTSCSDDVQVRRRRALDFHDSAAITMGF